MLKKTALVYALSLTLAACGGERVTLAKPPVALLTCTDEAEAPDLPVVPWALGVMADIQAVQAKRDAATLDYLLAMRSAWGSCHAAVAGTRAWADSMND